MVKKNGKIDKKVEKLTDFTLNPEYRFKINSRDLSKNHKEIITLDKNIFNSIRFNSPLKSVHRGSNNILDISMGVGCKIWSDLVELISLLECNVNSNLYECDWYVSSITLPYIYDAIAVKGSPDYKGYDDKKLSNSEKTLLDKFVEYSKDIQNIKRVSRKKYVCIVKWFMYYLSKIHKNNILAIIYSRDENFRSTFNVSNTDYSYSVLLRFVEFLKHQNMVLNFTGNKLYSSRVGSLLVINPKIFKLVGYTDETSAENCVTDYKDKILKVTSPEGKEIDPDLLLSKLYYKKMYSDAESVLKKYHNVMDLSDPKINGYPLGSVRLHRTIRESYGESSRWFDNGSFQGKPKEIRKMLTLLDEDTVSLDFKSLHPAILLYYKGVSLKDHDPYPIIKGIKIDKVDVNKFKRYYGLETYDPLRNLVKKLFLAMINADSVNSAVGSMYDDLRNDNLKKGTFKEHTMKYVGIGQVDLHKIAKKILKHNKVISCYLGTGEGRKLQFIDSNIIRYCLDKLSDEKIPCIPVHDSISCRTRDKQRVKEVMTEAFIYIVGEGSENNCIIEEE